MEGMAEADLTVNADHAAQGCFTYRSCLAEAELLLTNGTAIFACNDHMAVAHREALDVPGDIAIAGPVGRRWAESASPGRDALSPAIVLTLAKGS